MGALNDETGPVDRHLDEMFDRLAGTGAQGRRLLAEAEDHLCTAASEARARGLDGVAAEHEAVARFGPPAVVVDPASSATTGLMRTTLVAWTVGGIALVVAGVAGLAARVIAHGFAGLLLATDGFGVVDVAGACGEHLATQGTNPCASPGSMIGAGWFVAGVPAAEVALLLLVVGAAMVGVVAVARRVSRGAGWLPRRQAVAGAVAVLGGVVAAMLLPWSVFEAAVGPWAYLSGHLAVALTTLAAAIIGWRHHRHAVSAVSA